MLRLLPLVLLLASPLSAQEARGSPEPILVIPVAPSTSVAASADSLDGRRWRTALTFLGATGGYVTLGVVGGVIGFHMDASACGDVCLPDGMWVGWVLGSTVGAGLGAHLGSRGTGSRTWALVGAGATQVALGLYGAATDNPVPILIPVSILAATVAERASGAR